MESGSRKHLTRAASGMEKGIIHSTFGMEWDGMGWIGCYFAHASDIVG